MSTGIGARIQSRRKELKMGADELAQKIGKSKATLYRYENGDIENVPLDILKPIAEALEVSPAYLMGWEKVQKNNDIITDIVIKLRSDENYLEVCNLLKGLDSEQLSSVKHMLSAFSK